MKRKLLLFLLLFSSFYYSQLTARQFLKMKQTPLTEITELLKNYGYKLEKVNEASYKFINDQNIISDMSIIIITPNTVNSEKPKVIMFYTFEKKFIHFFKIQITNLGFNFLHTKEVFGEKVDVYQNNNDDFFILSFDETKGISNVKYFTNNE